MRERRFSRWWTAAAIALAAPLLLLWAVPWLVDVASVRAALERKLSAAAHGEIAWETLRVSMLPHPQAVARGIHGRFATAAVAAEQAQVSLRLWPLVLGRVEIQSMVLTRPTVSLRIAAASPGAQGPPRNAIEVYRFALAPLVRALDDMAAEGELQVEEGHVELIFANGARLEMPNVSVHARLSAQALVVQASARSSWWTNLELQANLKRNDLAAYAQLVLDDFNLPQWDGPRGWSVAVQGARVSATFATDGHSSIKATGEVNIGLLRATRAERTLALHDIDTAGTVELDALQTRGEASRLRVGTWLQQASTTLTLSADWQRPHFAFSAQLIDVPGMREVLSPAFEPGSNEIGRAHV